MSVVVTEESWFSRIGGAFKGIIVGLLLTVISVPLLFWNEGRAVKTHKGLQEGAGAVVALTSNDVASENEGKFVHLSGEAKTEEVLRDEQFGVEFNGIRLKRNAEMFQWVQHTSTKSKKKLGGGKETTTTYTYEKEWKSGLQSSSGFHDKSPQYQNPESMAIQSNSQQAGNVNLGGFKLPGALVNQIRKSERLPITKENLSPEVIENVVIKQEGGGDTAYWRANGAYTDPPQVGDIRVSFSSTPNAEVSVMSQQAGESFQPYKTQYGTELNMLSMGKVSPESMIEAAEAANVTWTWILRGVGSLLMFLGFVMLLRPLSVLADVVPLFGSIVGAGTGIVAFLLAGAGSLVTISIAWIFYRPLLGIILLIIAGGLVFVLFSRTRKARGYAQDEMAASQSDVIELVE